MFLGAQLKLIQMEIMSKNNGAIVVQDALDSRKVCTYNIELTLNFNKKLVFLLQFNLQILISIKPVSFTKVHCGQKRLRTKTVVKFKGHFLFQTK